MLSSDRTHRLRFSPHRASKKSNTSILTREHKWQWREKASPHGLPRRAQRLRRVYMGALILMLFRLTLQFAFIALVNHRKEEWESDPCLWPIHRIIWRKHPLAFFLFPFLFLFLHHSSHIVPLLCRGIWCFVLTCFVLIYRCTSLVDT